jgi:hypothetical protein
MTESARRNVAFFGSASQPMADIIEVDVTVPRLADATDTIG